MKRLLKYFVFFGMMAALMVVLTLVMTSLPNIHLLGVFIVSMTVVFRAKALIPVYMFVLIYGLIYGFPTWWVPYLYIWPMLWLMTMPLPCNMPKWLAPAVYMAVCGLHGLLYGVMYAPFQALVYGLNFEATLTWIAFGLPYDLIHGASNFLCGVLIVPLISAFKYSKKILDG